MQQILAFVEGLHEAAQILREDHQTGQELLRYSIDYHEVADHLRASAINLASKAHLLAQSDAAKFIIELFSILRLGSLKEESLSNIKRAALFLQIEKKVACFEEVIESAISFKADISTDTLFINSKYQRTYQKIVKVSDPDPQKTQNETEQLRKLITITNAAVITEISQNHYLFGLISFGLSYPRFLLDFEEAELRNYAFLRDPKIEVLKAIWNLPENGAISRLKYINFEWIETNKMFYIPRNIELEVDILQEREGSVACRLLYGGSVQFSPLDCCSPHNILEIDTVIIHFHGGGFVALSSSTMQNYTRQWSKHLGIPVISIDYSKPPQNRFPVAVRDAESVYHFMVGQIHNYCNIRPQRIILAGDSAGGNLVCSLMSYIIQNNLQQPYGIFLAYPACDLRLVYSPSRLHAFTNPILHPSLLYLCLSEYLGEDAKDKQEDPRASPLLLTQAYLNVNRKDNSFPRMWPKTRIIVGDKDPLLDDSLRLCHKMVQSDIDVQCRIYSGMGHGFLNLQRVYSKGQSAINDSILLLKQLLQ